MNKKIVLPIIAVAIAATALGTGSFVNAEFGGGMGMNRGDRSEACQEFFDKNDYEGWKNFITSEATEFSSQENFENLKQVHELMADGKIEEAESLRAELGISRGGHGEGPKGGGLSGVHEAIANQDYAAWKAAMDEAVNKRGHQKEITIDEDTFAKLVAAHQARESGDHEKAREIHKELGFPGGPHKGNGQGLGKGFGNSADY